MSATSRVGWRPTIPPVQRKQVDTTVETVLKPPEPAKTRPCVDPAGKAAKVVGDEARPPAPAPGGGVLRVEIDAGHVIAINAIALPNHDAAGFRKEARHLRHRHPTWGAMQCGARPPRRLRTRPHRQAGPQAREC